MRGTRLLCVVLFLGLAIACTGEQAQEQPEATVATEHTPDRAPELVQPTEWWSVHPRPVYASLEKVGTYQDWFDVYELAPGTYAIYEPNQFEESICYLVLGDDRGVIIDTGNGIGDLRAVVEELTDLPVSVINTHTHYDHIGSNSQWDEVAVYDHPDEIARLRAGIDNARLQRYITDEYLWKPLPEGFDGATWTFPPTEPTTLMHDGDIIDLGGRTLEVIFTPGHAAGHACLLDTANRILFTGDHFYPGPLYAHETDVDIDLYIESNKKIATRVDEYDHVCAGHNDPWVDAEVIPRVSDAFETIFTGGGEFSEDEGLRRYRFDGFDVLIRTEQVLAKTEAVS